MRAYEGNCVEDALTQSFDRIAADNDMNNYDVLELQHDMQIEAEKSFDAKMEDIDSLINRYSIAADVNDKYEINDRLEKHRILATQLEEMYSAKNREASYDRICRKVEVGVPECIELFKRHGKPQAQVEVRWHMMLDKSSSFPILGYIDWLFPDGHIVDLKTARNIPTILSLAHAFQAYVYMEAYEAETMEFVYIGDRKREPVQSIFVYRDAKFRENEMIFRDAARKLGRMLRLSKKTLWTCLPQNPESFYFNTPVITDQERN